MGPIPILCAISCTKTHPECEEDALPIVSSPFCLTHGQLLQINLYHTVLLTFSNVQFFLTDFLLLIIIPWLVVNNESIRLLPFCHFLFDYFVIQILLIMEFNKQKINLHILILSKHFISRHNWHADSVWNINDHTKTSVLEVAYWPYILKMYIYEVSQAFENILRWPAASNPLLIKMDLFISMFRFFFWFKKCILMACNNFLA